MTGDGLGRGLSDMWRSVLLFVPAALAFAAILLVGYLIARLLRTAVTRGLHKAGLDRAVERGAAARLFAAGRLPASELCGRIVFYGILLFALQLAFGIWGPNPVSALLSDLIAWLPRLFVAIVLIIVAAAIARAAHDLIAAALGTLTYGRLLARAASIVIVSLGVIAALDQVKIATAVTQPVLIAILATIAGILIVGVGGGLIRPMQTRWENWLQRADAESTTIRDHARAYAEQTAATRADQEAAAARAQAFADHSAPDRTRVVADQAGPDRTRAFAAQGESEPITEQDAADRTRQDAADRARRAALFAAERARQADDQPGSPHPADTDAAATQVIPPRAVTTEPAGSPGGPTEADETQVIPPPRQAEKPHPTREPDPAAPGPEAAESEPTAEPSTRSEPGSGAPSAPSGAGDTESTQVLPAADSTTTRPLPVADEEDQSGNPK